MLHVTFVRRPGDRDRVYVERSDGTTTSWAFPSYGDELPHDLCHLVVEEELGLADGFWGLVDEGVDVRLVSNEATLMRGTQPLADGADLSGLLRAEAAVAALAGPGQMVALDAARNSLVAELVASRPEAVRRIERRLAEIRECWCATDDASITVRFARAG